MPNEVVIVAEDGTEHVFPAGFSPKRAAAIVRGRKTPELPAGATNGMLPQSTMNDPPPPSKRTVLDSVSGLIGFLAGDPAPPTPGRVWKRPDIQAAVNEADVMGRPMLPVSGAHAIKRGVAMIPTRAKAGQAFQQVAAKVGSNPVDVSRVGDVALRINQLAERGGRRPKVVFDFLKRATDPAKAEPTFNEMRDFYSNISRLSVEETRSLPPVIRRELTNMRVALDKALTATAAAGGQGEVYKAAMRKYAIASRMRELSEKAAKYGATAIGAGAAYKLLND